MINLRSSQGKAIEEARRWIASGHSRGVIAAPCGFGKSVVACAFIEAAERKQSKVWFGVDRQILVNDMSAKLDQFGIDHGVMMADHWRWRPHKRVQVVSLQTIEKRGWDADIDVLIVDEAHANMRKSFKQFVAASPRTKVIGLTATPFTAGMGQIYEYVVNPTTTNRQIEEGFLVPLKIYSCSEADMTGAKVVAGEWSDDEVASRGLKIVGDIVSTWEQRTREHFGGPVKTIVFSASVAHGADIVKSFRDAGYRFEQISYLDTDSTERDKLIAQFRAPDSPIHGLVSCGVLTRGFDVTDVKCGIMARPLRKAFSEFIQQVGRIQRAHDGKEFGLLLDHAGNVGRFGAEMVDLFENGVQSLDDTPDAKPPRKDLEEQQKKEVFCPKCGLMRSGRARVCAGCGFEWPMRSTVETEPGELQEIIVGKTRYADNARHLWEQTGTYALKHSAPDKQLGRARALFKEIAGRWPPAQWRLPAVPGPITPEVANKIKSRNIAYIRGRMRHAA